MTCPVCGQPMTRRKGEKLHRFRERKYCSVTCANRAPRKRLKEITTHGITLYRRGCRCETCKAANADRCARYRAEQEAKITPVWVPPDGVPCATVDNRDLFIDRHGETPSQVRTRRDKAIALCRTCPAIADCYVAGVSGQEWGIWGGVMLDGGKPASTRAGAL